MRGIELDRRAEIVPAGEVSGNRTGLTNKGRGVLTSENGLLIKRIYANYAVGPQDGTLLVDASAAPVYIQLPDSTIARVGELSVKKIDSSGNAVIIVPQSGEFVDNATSLSNTTQYDNFKVLPEPGFGWWVI